jgi:hypothetical protein
MNYTEIIVAKQRNGPLGTAKLNFNLQTGRFLPLDPHHDTPEYYFDENPEESSFTPF